MSLLTNDSKSLVTLIGPGGVGKTRVAIEVAAGLDGQAEGRFRDGVAFVALQSVRDHERVAPTIARAFGLRDDPGRSDVARIIEVLQGKSLLLVLDNFEQVLGAGELAVDELLQGCRDLAVLVTSRAPLRLKGEQRCPIRPLELPVSADGDGGAIAAVEEAPAGRLFLEFARERDPYLELTEDDARAIAGICRNLDGLPGALELAAAKLDVLSFQELLAESTSRLALLTEAPRDAPARHQSMEAMLRWSYELLPPSDQALFRRLGIFVGGWTLEAAVAIGDEATGNRRGVTDSLASLRNQSLIQPVEGANGSSRFALLETTREFALECLIEADELLATGAAHARYFASFAEEGRKGLAGPEQVWWGRRIDADLANCRAALTWAISDEADLDLGLRLANSLFRYWNLRGMRNEAREWMQRAADGSRQEGTIPRATALLNLGNLLYSVGVQPSQASYLASLELWRQLDDPRGAAAAQIGVAQALQRAGSYEEARRHFEQALGLNRSVNDPAGIATVELCLAELASAEGSLDVAAVLCRQALASWRGLRTPDWIAAALWVEGRNSRRCGLLDQAEEQLREAMAIAVDAGAVEYRACLHHELGVVALLHGQQEAAISNLHAARTIFDETDNVTGLIDCVDAFACVATAGQPSLAARLLGAANARRVELGAVIPASDRSLTEKAKESAVGAISEAAFNAIYRAGCNLALVYAIELAASTAVVMAIPSATPGPPPGTLKLTPRRKQFLEGVAAGMTDKAIADECFVSPKTVSSTIETIREQLGASNRAAAVAVAIRAGLI